MKENEEEKPKIFPLGDSALTIEFGNEISARLNNRVLKLADFFGNDDILYLREDLATGDLPKHSLGMNS
jgi:hypothetical protein